jgi:hypothetical protein
MPRRFWVVGLAFWPGLVQFESVQEVAGLLLGSFLASVLNVVIVSQWVWNEAQMPGCSDLLAILAFVS